MRITVAICTWNRVQLLARTLSRLERLRPPASSDLEVVVVNNNCTDATDELLESFSARLPLRRVWQPIPGLSNARNAAVDAATGDYVVWTDDDVLPDDDWLVAYESGFRLHRDAAFFGGSIYPDFEGAPRRWLIHGWHSIATAFASRDLGNTEFLLDHHRLPFGANFSVKACIQKKYRYDVSLGRTPGDALLSGEETALMRALLRDGHSGWWLPAAKVRHFIPSDRQTVGYLRSYFAGIGAVRSTNVTDGPQRVFQGVPLWLWRAAVAEEAKYLLGRLYSPPQHWLPHLAASSVAWGSISALRRSKNTSELIATSASSGRRPTR